MNRVLGNSGTARRRSSGLLGGLVVLAATGALLAPTASAVEIIESQSGTASDGWQAATCSGETPAPCSPETPGEIFTQAAGHPGIGFTQFIVKHHNGLLGAQTPVGDVHSLLVDLPAGLSVNPEATPRCQLKAGESPSECPADTKVGTSTLTAALVVAGIGESLTLPASPVYNLEPLYGQPARFGFSAAGNDVYLEPGVAWYGDYHEYFLIHAPRLELPEIPLLEGVRILKNRLVFEGNVGKGEAGRGPFLTNPSTCLGGASQSGSLYSTFLHADSYQEEAPAFPTGSQALEAPLPPGVQPTGCGAVPFSPSLATTMNTGVTDSPSGPTISVNVPYDVNAAIANSNLRTAKVTTPAGLTLNPAAAAGLQACNDQQFGQGTANPVSCPGGSAIGTVSIQTPVLPPNSLTGTVFLGTQQSRDPLSGDEYRIFIDAESARYGQSVRLTGHVSADPKTGQLTTVVDEAPQLPFSSVQLSFDGSKGVLTSPPTCGPNVTAGEMTPWSGTAATPVADQGFLLSQQPNGQPCAKTLADRPFSPGFAAAPDSSQAGAYTPFHLDLSRGDGEQELKRVEVTLPPGATAKLAGVSYCPQGDIAHAAASSGAAEQADPSCPAASEIGDVSVRAGSGGSPLQIAGKAYLAGPYRGAPLSLVAVTPALAGPFDLGTVVVRVALFVDSETVRIHAVSDPIPDVFGGARLDLRSISVDVNRNDFTLNGTNCDASATAGTISGGGADPSDPGAFSSFGVSAPFQASGCDKLGFKPKLYLRLWGGMRRAQNPRFRAVLKAREGDANISRVAVGLPHALFLDQATLAEVCTRVQFAAEECPAKSIYGHAVAKTPLLDQPLRGPVYLRSSDHALPDLVAHLQGQVNVDLVGQIDSFHGGIRTTFASVPDVPVSKFVMTLPGGKKHGLLEASTNLCRKPVRAIVRIKGQNGSHANRRTVLRRPCHRPHHRHRKHHRHGRHRHHQNHRNR